MRRLILFGDSNTYGYDPRGFMGGRYPEEARWATMVRKALAEGDIFFHLNRFVTTI